MRFNCILRQLIGLHLCSWVPNMVYVRVELDFPKKSASILMGTSGRFLEWAQFGRASLIFYVR